METERPCCYTEYIGPKECWDVLGMRIRWTVPAIPSIQKMYMYDPLILRLCLECKKPVPIRDVTAWAWTHIFHADNHEGVYREIKLLYNPDMRTWDDNGVTLYEFSALLFPTNDGRFRLTFNVKFLDNMIWANKFQKDLILNVAAARKNNMWVKSARQSQITRNIFIGNFLSVLISDEMGFRKVLSLDDITNDRLGLRTKDKAVHIIRLFVDPETGTRKIFPEDLKKDDSTLLIGTEPGGGKVIPEEKIVRIVNWLKEVRGSEGNVLVGDFTGQGRAGSSLTAYIYANNPNLTFEEAYQFVRKRRFIFCHKGLKETLARLYPRD